MLEKSLTPVVPYPTTHHHSPLCVIPNENALHCLTLMMMDYAACHYYRTIVMMDLSSTLKDSALIASIIAFRGKNKEKQTGSSDPHAK